MDRTLEPQGVEAVAQVVDTAMNGIIRSGGVTTALIGFVVYVITRGQTLLTDTVLSWLVIGAAVALISLAFAWAMTYGIRYQFVDVDFRVPPDTTAMTSTVAMVQAREKWQVDVRRAKRMLMLCSQGLCLMPASGLSVIIQLMPLEPQVRHVYWTIWGICAATLSALSPYLWRAVFDWLWPWMMAREKQA